MTLLASLASEFKTCTPYRASGKVLAVRGPQILATIPDGAVGDWCQVELRCGESLRAQIMAFQDNVFSLVPLGSIEGIAPGAVVTAGGEPLSVLIPENPLGCVMDAFGRVLNRESCGISSQHAISLQLDSAPPPPLSRPPITQTLETGIRVVDGLLTLGVGQRVGLFAGAGVGKSTLLGMLARNAEVDATVIGLVGERGREVGEFLDHCLQARGLARSVVVVSTSDETALTRATAADTATAIAEHLRDQGKRVLLLVDSLTRVARAVRDVSLSAGEIPVRAGYTPRVYSVLPKLLERAGTSRNGSITAVYTVLVNGDDEPDPLGEEVKSILDGHIVLDQRIASSGIRPAVDLSRSVSRLFTTLHDRQYLQAAEVVRGALNRLRRDKDLLLLGGTPDAALTRILAEEPSLTALVSQDASANGTCSETIASVRQVARVLSGE